MDGWIYIYKYTHVRLAAAASLPPAARVGGSGCVDACTCYLYTHTRIITYNIHHSMTILGERAFVFGGVGNDAMHPMNGAMPAAFFMLDLNTMAWQV